MVPLQNRSFAAAPGTAGAGAKSPPAPMRAALLGWYRRNRAALPWRDTSDPYRIWVSEVMLQQTRITTVLPHYQDFLKAFPTVESLSRSSRERVLEQWAGMGYYRRAENLHRAARTVVKKFGGKFPRDFHQARQLPGVGDYTARAILSIAYKKPLAVLDGNVAVSSHGFIDSRVTRREQSSEEQPPSTLKGFSQDESLGILIKP